MPTRVIFRIPQLGHRDGDQVRGTGEKDQSKYPLPRVPNNRTSSGGPNDLPTSTSISSSLNESWCAKATAQPDSVLSSLLLLNARSMNPSAQSDCRWKLSDLVGYVDDILWSKRLFPFIAITESWLKSYNSDAQLKISGYSLSQSDQSKRTGGGVMLYSLSSIPVLVSEAYDDIFVRVSSMFILLLNYASQQCTDPQMQATVVSQNS